LETVNVPLLGGYSKANDPEALNVFVVLSQSEMTTLGMGISHGHIGVLTAFMLMEQLGITENAAVKVHEAPSATISVKK
jgi:hypothetical protein